MAANLDDISEDELDEWLFSSMKRYKNLYMFELQQLTRSIEWVGTQSICLGGCEINKKNELLELIIPERLLYTANSDGLCKDRDFQLKSGGFADHPIYHIKHLKNSRLVVTSEDGSNAIKIYQLAESSNDIIKKIKSVDSPFLDASAPFLAIQDSKAIFGSSLHNISMADLSTENIYYRSNLTHNGKLSGLEFADSNIFVTCCQDSGCMWIIDPRENNNASQSAPVKDANLETSVVWTMTLSKSSCNDENGSPVFNGDKLARLGSNGHIIIHDIRQLNQPLIDTFINHKLSRSKHEFMKIELSPNGGQYLSVSGFDACVQVYDTSLWTDTDNGNIYPVFIHDGHAACCDDVESLQVLTHMWHPWQANTLFSTANDSSLHAWEWQLP